MIDGIFLKTYWKGLGSNRISLIKPEGRIRKLSSLLH